MSSARISALGAALASGLLLAAGSAASGATPKSCNKLRGRDLLSGRVVRAVRLKLPTIAPRGADSGSENRRGLFACRLPNGPVHQLATDGLSFFKGEPDTPVESSVVKIGTSAGAFATLIETDNTLMGESFLTDRVVNAATGRRLYTYLNTSFAASSPSLAAPLRTLLGPTGTLVGLFPLLEAGGSQKTDRLVAFVSSKGQTLDSAANGSIPAASIALSGDVVTWTDAAIAKSATLPAR